MNMQTEEDKAAVRAFFAEVNQAEKEGKAAGAAGRAALDRLVAATMHNTGSQAGVILQWLASIYNGNRALRVQLDDIRRLDWTLQKDLAAVVLGCQRPGFADTAIAEAFAAAGGPEAVDRLLWYTTGKLYRQALDNLIAFARANRECSSGRWLVDALTSMACGRTTVDLARLGYIDNDLTTDFVRVLEGLVGAGRGVLHCEDIQDALRQANLLQ